MLPAVISSLTRSFSVLKFKTTWENFHLLAVENLDRAFFWAMDHSRSYNEGLAGALNLLNCNEEFKDRLDPDKYEIKKASYLSRVLHFLDKLDRWEDYLKALAEIRTLDLKWPQYLSTHREWIIKANLADHKAGRSVRRHKQAVQLTSEEYLRRLEWAFRRGFERWKLEREAWERWKEHDARKWEEWERYKRENPNWKEEVDELFKGILAWVRTAAGGPNRKIKDKK